MLRVFMIPFFLVLLLNPQFQIPGQTWICLAIYVAASLTDTLDGYIARKYNMVTNFGKFMDPLADKLLVCSAIICFAAMGIMPVWIVLIIIGREFIISGFRLVASDKGVVIAAGISGKIKTVVQMITIGFLIVNLDGPVFNTIETVLIYLSLILTVVSLIDYLYHNWNVLREDG